MAILPLSDKEREVLKVLKDFFKKNKYMPTRAEIGNEMGYPESSGSRNVGAFLKNMEEKGYVKLGKGWRNIEILK